MANRRVRLYKYVKLNTVGWRYCRPVYATNNKLKPHLIVTPNGVEEHHPEGQYFLGYRNGTLVWEPVGSDAAEAQRLLKKKQAELEYQSHGGAVLKSEPESTVPSGTVRQAIDDFLEDVENGDFHEETYEAKEQVLNEFADYVKVKSMSQLTRKHCLTYLNKFLREKGNEDRTRFNKFLHLRQWLNANGITDLLTTADAPKYCQDDPVGFEDDEITAFFKHCSPKHRLLFAVLLLCGLRFKEALTLRWVDIDFQTGMLKIQPRPEYKFKPKKHHIRDVALNDELLAELKAAKLVSKCPLLFVTRSSRPRTHMLEDCKSICKKAKIAGEKSHLHVFRATYCTTLLRQGVPIPDVQYLMGHKDVASTMRYMVKMRKEDLRQRLNLVKFPVAVAVEAD
jgi:integrase/recombinase XerD